MILGDVGTFGFLGAVFYAQQAGPQHADCAAGPDTVGAGFPGCEAALIRSNRRIFWRRTPKRPGRAGWPPREVSQRG